MQSILQSRVTNCGRRRHRSAPLYRDPTCGASKPMGSTGRPPTVSPRSAQKANLIWVLTCLQRPHAYYSAANQSRESDVTIQGGQGRARMLSLTRCKKLNTIFKKKSGTRDKFDMQFRHSDSDRSGDKCQDPFMPFR